MASPIQLAMTQFCPSWEQIAEDSLQEAFSGMTPLIELAPSVVSRVAFSDTAPSGGDWNSSDPDLFVSIKAPLHGDIEGDLVWLISWEAARSFWRSCLERSPNTLSELSDVEVGTMLELGTQFSAAFGGAFSGKSNLSVSVGPIRIAIEMLSAIVHTVFSEAAANAPYLGCGFNFGFGETPEFRAMVFLHNLGAVPVGVDKEAA